MMTGEMSKVEFSSKVFRASMMTTDNKKGKNDLGKCLGFPVTVYGPVIFFGISFHSIFPSSRISSGNR